MTLSIYPQSTVNFTCKIPSQKFTRIMPYNIFLLQVLIIGQVKFLSTNTSTTFERV